MPTMAIAMLPIESRVLKWAIMSSGWNTKELSDKTGISITAIERWVTQNSSVKVSDLKKISQSIGRPLSILLLPKPPIENNLPYYRRITGTNATQMKSKEMLTVIRNARYVRSSAKELLDMRSEDAQPHITHRTLEDDPETVAETERKVLGLDMGRRRGKGVSIDQFIHMEYQSLREKIESLNILVMQAGMDVNDARGFTLLDSNPKLILVNGRDMPRPKFFTLLHEYAHLLLDTDGICLIDLNADNAPRETRAADIEKWCNNFAGAVIMPKQMVLQELDEMADDTPDRVVDRLSAKFCSSKTATVVRILNLIEDSSLKKVYLNHYEVILSKPPPKPGGGGGDGGRNMAQECINKNGRLYTKLVSSSKSRNLITVNDMVRYLRLNTKHFETLEGLI